VLEWLQRLTTDVTSIILTPAPRGTSRTLRPGTAALVAVIGTAVCTLAVLEAVVDAPRTRRLDRALVEALVVGVPILVGLYAARSPHQLRFGLMLVATGGLWSLTALGESDVSLPYSIGRVAAWLVFPVLAYLILAFPDGRIARRLDHVLFAAVTAIVAVLFAGSALFVEQYPQHTPWATCTARCPANAFLVLDHEPAVMSQVVQPVREGLAVLVFLGVTWSLVARLRRAGFVQRRSTAPVTVMGVISALVLIAYFPVRAGAPDSAAVETLGNVWALCIPGIAAAFLVGLMRRRLMVAGVLSRLGVDLGRDLTSRELCPTLAAALRDPTLAVLLPDAAPGRWIDGDGHQTSLAAAAASGRAVTRIDEDGRPVAAIVHDPALAGDDELLDAVGSMVGLALRHDRLHQQVDRSRSQLEESRKRIARIADTERARIERDLHDGAQQHLVMLRIKLSLAEELVRLDPVEGAAAVRELGHEVDQAVDEIRSLAQGVYPPVLSDRGLGDALRSAIIESPIPVQLSTRGITRHPPEIETAVYFTCVEAFQNALKHGKGATRVWLTVRQNDALSFEVRDDGVGFAPPGGTFNGGLGNMRDRLEAIGGRLLIESSPGHGTRIRGAVPLG
jgi:signal transduction histidine kinase